MGNTNYRSFIFRRLSLHIGLIGGLGGIFPDFDHFLHFATGGVVPFTFLHQPAFLLSKIFIIVALIGLTISLFWQRKKSFPLFSPICQFWLMVLSFSLGVLSHCVADKLQTWF